MSSLVKRLRDVAGFIEKEHGRIVAAACLATEAADRIEQLEAALRLLHDNVVEAWPSVADLGPVANARAVLKDTSNVLV